MKVTRVCGMAGLQRRDRLKTDNNPESLLSVFFGQNSFMRVNKVLSLLTELSVKWVEETGNYNICRHFSIK